MKGEAMRVLSFLIVGSLAVTAAAAQNLITMSRAQAERLLQPKSAAQIYNGPRAKVSMWIWSDKYTYRAGDNLTLRWTVKTNGDLYPYTVFVYRQNNQTGKKTYFPGGGEDPTDINGNTAAQGFQPMQLTDATKAVLIGSGGTFPAVSMPNELGMHTFVVQLRDYTGTHPLKTAYMKVGVVQGSADLTGDITSDRTLTNDTEWHLRGGVFVKNGATLTIEPGTFIFGQSGTPPSLLLITQTGKIMAKGTRSRPIIMTSDEPFGQRNRGDWAGLVLLGKAPINVPANAGGSTHEAGTFYIEGLNTTPDGLYGGNDPTWNCGTLEYVRVEYSGFILSPNNEINSFTWGGCGTGTVADHLQAIAGLDDTFEWFGGTMDAKYLVGGLGRDDYLDFQLGFTGRIQYLIGYQSPDLPGNRGIEGDNSEYDAASTPFSSPTVYNATFIGSGIPAYDEPNGAHGIFLRRGARGSFNNIVVTGFNNSCMIINDADTQAQADAGNVLMNGILCSGNNIANQGANTLAGQIPQAYSQEYAQGLKGNGAGKNFIFADPLLTRPREYSDPDFGTMFGSPVYRAGWVQPPDNGFFDQSAQFLGAMGDVDWTEEWTNFTVDSDIAP
jgi:hypothetical protein